VAITLDATSISTGVIAFSSLLTAVTALVTRHGQIKTQEKLEVVHQEVKTANGIALGALADRVEGRDISRNVPVEDRTTTEQHYVDKLDAEKAQDVEKDARAANVASTAAAKAAGVLADAADEAAAKVVATAAALDKPGG
jgi:hypothetical protein